MSYTTLGALEPCVDDLDCYGADLCCQDYCRTGADIEAYCGEMVELPPVTVTGKPLTKPALPIPGAPPAKTAVGLGTIAVLAAVVGAAAWVAGRG